MRRVDDGALYSLAENLQHESVRNRDANSRKSADRAGSNSVNSMRPSLRSLASTRRRDAAPPPNVSQCRYLHAARLQPPSRARWAKVKRAVLVYGQSHRRGSLCICLPASARTQRSHAARLAFHARTSCPSTGKTKCSCSGYVVDH